MSSFQNFLLSSIVTCDCVTVIHVITLNSNPSFQNKRKKRKKRKKLKIYRVHHLQF